MPRSTPFLRALDGLIELGWLFIVIGVPIFFNVRDYRVFEPDKIVLLRNTILAMAAVWLVKCLYLAPFLMRRGVRPPGEPVLSGNGMAQTAPRPWYEWLLRRPIMVAATAFALLYLLATVHSILPKISFWGSYDRLEGGYTYLCYFTLFLLVATHLRSWRQVERLVTAIILASVPVAGYSWLQHFSADPLVWFNPEITVRTPSTLGNPIFLAAYLLMAVPFTLYRLLLGIQAVLQGPVDSESSLAELWRLLGLAGYGVAVIMQLGGIGFSGSRGPALGLLAALIIFGLCLAVRQRIAWLLRLTVVAAGLLVVILGATNTVYRSDKLPSGGISRFLHLLPSESGSSEVRSLLWKSSLSLAKEHPVLGCGPEVLLFCWYPNYPSELRKVEQANAAPDRSHDEEIDVLLTTGVLGLLAYLAFLGSAVWVLVALLRLSGDLRATALISALLAAFVGHVVEGITGIAFSATLVLLWTVGGVATALATGRFQGLVASRAPEGAVGTEDTPLAWDVVEPSRVAVASGTAARSAGRAAGPARGGAGTRRERPPRSRAVTSGAAGSARRSVERTARDSYAAAVAALSAGRKAILGLIALAVAALILVSGLLFASNIAVVLADVDYRQGVNLEQEAGICSAPAPPAECSYAGGPGAYTVGLQLYQNAIDAYQSALDSQPSHNAAFLFLSPTMPSEDTYYLFLGKTMLEYAATLDTGANSRPAVEAQVRAALDVFQRAARNNPLNPDHPRNIAKLYSFWGATAFSSIDLGKLRLADASYAQASALAPHNTDILDEWALLDIKIGESSPRASATAWFATAQAHLDKAVGLYPEGGNAYRDLGRIYAQYGTWAEERKDAAGARSDYQRAVAYWLQSLGAPPVQQAADHYQTVYPLLAATYATKLNDICAAGQYAQYGLNSIKNGTLQPADTHTQSDLQATVSAALARKCTISGQ